MLLGRTTGRVAAGAEVLQRMQSGRRLPQDQGQQREPGDQRLPDCEQVRYLGKSLNLIAARRSAATR
jgi:hypothetical protein